MEPTTIILGGVVLWLLRGRTGDVGLLGDADLESMTHAVCVELENRPDAFQDARAVAVAVGKHAYPGLSWPPAPLATASHKAAWSQLEQWGANLIVLAADAGVSPCAYLDTGAPVPVVPIPLIPIVPVDPGTPRPGFALGGIPELPPAPAPSPQYGTDDPTPGSWYQIGSIDAQQGLLGIAGRAYGLSGGDIDRLTAARWIDEDNRHRPSVRMRASGNSFEILNFGPEIVSLGAPWQIIYIPHPPAGGW